MEPALDLVVCLACGRFRPPPSAEPECPSCDYVGWANWSSLSERERARYSAIGGSWEEISRRAHLPLRARRIQFEHEQRADDELPLHELEGVGERRHLTICRDEPATLDQREDGPWPRRLAGR